MAKVICLVMGVTIGGFLGIVLMCIFQINTINQYERKILKLQKELDESRKLIGRSDKE